MILAARRESPHSCKPRKSAAPFVESLHLTEMGRSMLRPYERLSGAYRQ